MQRQFNADGGLLTYVDDAGDTRCVGSLLVFAGHGVFDAELGRVDVTPEAAERHNRVLDAALVEGLDKNCAVGQGGLLYVTGNTVKTWLGTVVGESRPGARGVRMFTRNGMTFSGKVAAGAECAYFKRTA